MTLYERSSRAGASSSSVTSSIGAMVEEKDAFRPKVVNRGLGRRQAATKIFDAEQ